MRISKQNSVVPKAHMAHTHTERKMEQNAPGAHRAAFLSTFPTVLSSGRVNQVYGNK